MLKLYIETRLKKLEEELLETLPEDFESRALLIGEVQALSDVANVVAMAEALENEAIEEII